jgi:hypothetical protein
VPDVAGVIDPALPFFDRTTGAPIDPDRRAAVDDRYGGVVSTVRFRADGTPQIIYYMVRSDTPPAASPVRSTSRARIRRCARTS